MRMSALRTIVGVKLFREPLVETNGVLLVELGFEVDVDAVGLPRFLLAAWSSSSSLTYTCVGVVMVSALFYFYYSSQRIHWMLSVNKVVRLTV